MCRPTFLPDSKGRALRTQEGTRLSNLLAAAVGCEMKQVAFSHCRNGGGQDPFTDAGSQQSEPVCPWFGTALSRAPPLRGFSLRCKATDATGQPMPIQIPTALAKPFHRLRPHRATMILGRCFFCELRPPNQSAPSLDRRPFPCVPRSPRLARQKAA